MQKLVGSDALAGDDFGASVAFDGATAIVGAPNANINNNVKQGAAYFYGGTTLGLVVSAPDKVARGSNFTSETIATNSGSAASSAVTVKIAVPTAVSFISANATQGSCREASNVVTCDFGAIDGNAGTVTANVTLKATGDAGTTIENTASIANATPPLYAGAPTSIYANQPPVASDGTLTTDENTSASGTLKATDPDGNPLTFSIVSMPSRGSVMLDDTSTGAYTYAPDQGYSGNDSFTFKANDGQADSNTATISITVKAAPPPPPPPSGGGGGGAAGPFGLALLALVGLVACLRRRR